MINFYIPICKSMGSIKECSVLFSAFICNRIPSKLLTASRYNFAINSGFLLDEATLSQIKFRENPSIQPGFTSSCPSKCHKS